ncbi:DUF1272 domain-containing protein [Allohahella sp. A8]|uniref:DUF1272 domain-containing protein n=1 Tax=Allohahella sp. A8 TaxID=3141461 RepID=UPI000C0A5A44|nr:urease [Hahellaceae bacterium]
MLELRPNCECCNTDLPFDSSVAMICSYECTFCKKCVNEILENVCPNCGGGFRSRPIRPKVARRSGTSIEHQPASDKRVHTTYSMDELKSFSESAKHVKPELR